MKSLLCSVAGKSFGICLILLSPTVMAQSVTIAVTPTSGVESVVPTVTWSSTGVSSCTAMGGWSGAKANSGSETLPAIDRSVSYGLACLTPDGDIVISWTAPTQNTNGTMLTDLAQFRIYVATSITGLAAATPAEVGAAVTTHTVRKANGRHFVAVTAVNAHGIESALSNTPSKDITAQSVTAQAAVEVIPRPKAPAVNLQ